MTINVFVYSQLFHHRYPKSAVHLVWECSSVLFNDPTDACNYGSRSEHLDTSSHSSGPATILPERPCWDKTLWALFCFDLSACCLSEWWIKTRGILNLFCSTSQNPSYVDVSLYKINIWHLSQALVLTCCNSDVCELQSDQDGECFPL